MKRPWSTILLTDSRLTALSNRKEKIITKLYDKLLYWYLYAWIVIDHKVDEYQEHRANLRWIRKNGPYKG